ncbi:MAG: hypothetical protein WC313_03980 [Candidatus Kapaibacterium sp.]
MKTPVDSSPHELLQAETGDVIVLCEGLQGYDNSALTLIKSNSGVVLEEYFKQSNSGDYLGDTANDILITGDTALIALSTSSTIRSLRVSTGAKISDIKLPENCTPRKITAINDNEFCVTCLLRSSIFFFSLDDTSNRYEVPVGPQPEGITYFNGNVFVANSAYGDFNYMHPDAETVSVVGAKSRSESRKIKAGTNTFEVLVNHETNRLYAVYYHLPSLDDSTGGIYEYDLSNFNVVRKWSIRARNVCFNRGKDSLFFISQQPKGSSMSEDSGIAVIDLNDGNSEMIINNTKRFDIWYGLAVSPYDDSIWICNSVNHVNKGKILVYSHSDYISPSRIFDVGLNPNKILFY